METILVHGCSDVGSAVAHVLFSGGYRVVIHDRAKPAPESQKPLAARA
jgi:Trk K+ transport system NAD-binding subunit